MNSELRIKNYEFFFGAVDSQPAFQGFAGKVPATFR